MDINAAVQGSGFVPAIQVPNKRLIRHGGSSMCFNSWRVLGQARKEDVRSARTRQDGARWDGSLPVLDASSLQLCGVLA